MLYSLDLVKIKARVKTGAITTMVSLIPVPEISIILC